MQDMKTGEGGLLQVTLEGINLKFMHNQVCTSSSRRPPGPSVLLYNKISSQALGALSVSKRESLGQERGEWLDGERNQRGGHSDWRDHQALSRCSREPVLGTGKENEAWWLCCPPIRLTQCEWERLTWPLLRVSAFLYSQGVLLLVVLL